MIDKVVAAIKNILNAGPDNWRDRLAKHCELTSPSGQTFKPAWRKDPRSYTKKLGIFEFPGIKGALVQDLEVSASKYNFSLFFTGKDCDLDAQAFYGACREKGGWTIIHPVYGELSRMYLVSLTETVDPVEAGGMAAFETEWIEALDPETLKSPNELLNEIKDLADKLNNSAAMQFAEKVKQNSLKAVNAIKKATDAYSKLVDAALSPLFTLIDAMDIAVTGIRKGIQDVMLKTKFTALSLAGQIQALAQVPAKTKIPGPRAAQTIHDAYIDLIERSSKSAKDFVTNRFDDLEAERNRVATSELGLLAAGTGMALGVGGAEMSTREAAIRAVDNVNLGFNVILNTIDGLQAEGVPIDKQFLAQNLSYDLFLRLFSTLNQYLLSVVPSLKVERTLILQRPMTPIEIVLQEYGGLGPNDELLDTFIETNNLKGDDILMLDRGRTVKVYV
jgi:hypothetical protein